jgi:hypothetical protein
MHQLIRDAAAEFLRGDTSVVDFTYAFRNAMDVVTRERVLSGHEVLIFHALEDWENSGWACRPAIVDRLRMLVAVAARASEDDPPP